MSEPFSIEIITSENYTRSMFSSDQIVDFLCKNLGPYGDPADVISECLDHAFGVTNNRRGFVLVAPENSETAKSGNILGAAVVCETGMSRFVPENLLVYIAVDHSLRGSGLGKALALKAIETARGDMALHVDPQNPARHLFEKIGFVNTYLEMRFSK